MGLNISNNKVVAIHQLTKRWAIYRDAENKLFALPVQARAFVLEKQEEAGGSEYLEAYDLCVGNDGCLEEAATSQNWVENLDADSEEQAIVRAGKNQEEEEREKAKRANQ